MKVELTSDEIALIIKALMTGQFPIQQHNGVYTLVTRLRALISS